MNASRTALAAALMRAIHTRLDRPRVIDDAWGDRLVSDHEKAELAQRIRGEASPEARARLDQLADRDVIDAVLRRHPSYGGVVLRTRWAEDALPGAVAHGARQYLLLGAGLDSFCVRQPDFAHVLDVFEVDHPASQALKRERLAAVAVVPGNVHFVAADLAHEDLGSALAAAGFRSDVPSFFSWLGVTVYLTRAANETTLRAISSCAAPGSEIAFTYIDQRALDAGAPQLDARRTQRAAQGEPWLSGFDPTAIADDLRALGLSLVEDLDGDALTARYCAGRSDRLAAARVGHVARARIGS